MRSETGKIHVFYSEILNYITVGLIEKGLLFPGKMFVAGICLFWKLMEYTNDHSLDACIIPAF